MRAVVQRTASASVSVGGEFISSVGAGLTVLLGVKCGDTLKDAGYIADKILNLRIFDDENGVMNRSVAETGGEILLVSQFTLYGDARKGRRPSYSEAAKGSEAEGLYIAVADLLSAAGVTVKCGRFGADMQVSLVNDGPVTILLDSSKVI